MSIDQWRGELGDNYHLANSIDTDDIENRQNMWFKIFDCMDHWEAPPRTILDVGAGNGANILAIQAMYDQVNDSIKDKIKPRFYAVEPNEKARENLGGLLGPDIFDIYDGTIHELPYTNQFADLVLTYGVLIHVDPRRDELVRAIKEVHRVSKKYIVCCEYFNPEFQEIKGWRASEAIWKGDYGSLYLDTFDDLRLLGWGFEWKKYTGLDNVTWWLFEKVSANG